MEYYTTVSSNKLDSHLHLNLETVLSKKELSEIHSTIPLYHGPKIQAKFYLV